MLKEYKNGAKFIGLSKGHRRRALKLKVLLKKYYKNNK